MVFKRFRRLRKTETLRNLVADVRFSLDQLIMPYFVVEGESIKNEISSMPNQFHFSIDRLLLEIEEIQKLGIRSILLFGIPSKKDPEGSEAWNSQGIVARAIRSIKAQFPEICIIADVCLCEYTSTGHCGVCIDDQIDNDRSLPLIAKTALCYARAGADIISPSDMMDGRIKIIRETLDEQGFEDLVIMSYSSKFSSSYYGPFRVAVDSCPQFGNRKSYQMDFRRSSEFLDKARSDIDEGADIIMVKPALAYLDLVARLSENLTCPLAVYNVSGEYSMIKAGAEKNLINEKELVLENIHAFVRAGAQIIITYHAKDIARWYHG